MDNFLIPLWYKKVNSLKKVCDTLNIHFLNISPLKLTGYKGTALVSEGNRKYVIK